MPEGDSLTNGNGDTQAINEGGYRLALGDWMNTSPRGCAMTMIGPYNNGFANGQGRHDGLVGSTIVDHRGTLPGYLTGSYPADLLLMMLGTNDVNNGVSPSTALTSMAGLLADARGARPAIRILLSKCLDGLDSTFHTNINTFNDGLAPVVATENAAGGHVALWDGYSAVGTYTTTYWDDALHLKATGYALYKAELQTQLYNFLGTAF